MTTRREFLQTTLAGLATAGAAAVPLSASQAAAGSLKHPLTGSVGLQLYSLRHIFEKGDVAGTLARVRQWGFTDIEVAGFYDLTPADYAAALKKAGLRAASYGAGYEQLRDDTDSVIRNAQAVGARYVMTAWIPHDRPFSREVAEAAAGHFDTWGRKLKDAGLQFAYHVHGYEFQPGADGTLFDLIAKSTDPALVAFEMDVFWVARGGGDPVALFRAHPGRFPLTHLKDIRKGTTLCDPTGTAPDETSVILGEGMIDWPGVLREANKQGTKYHFIEDEHPESEKQIPVSLQYLANLKL